MKVMIASDLHGSLYYTAQMKEAFLRENACRLVLLGDLLYHGPRNDLPREYDPKGVASLLNEMRESLLCVRGNCEAEVDQMMLRFPVLADYAALFWEGRTLYAVHGHQSWLADFPMKKGDVLMTGHTHIPVLRRENAIFHLNPGSVSIPKEGNPPTYAVLENGIFSIKDFEGHIVKSIAL